MTHKPAVPPGSTPPYPAHPAPHAHSARTDPPPQGSDNEQDAPQAAGRVTALGAAVGIGSAAIVAALLYVRHRRA